MGLEKPKLQAGKKFASGTISVAQFTGNVTVRGLDFKPSMIRFGYQYAPQKYSTISVGGGKVRYQTGGTTWDEGDFIQYADGFSAPQYSLSAAGIIFWEAYE